MRKLIAIIIILFCIAIPARADYGPRPPAWETVAATKISRQEHKRRTPTPTMEPYPYPVPTDEPYPEPEGEVSYTFWYRLVSWFAE
jgi:hypothetical protein